MGPAIQLKVLLKNHLLESDLFRNFLLDTCPCKIILISTVIVKSIIDTYIHTLISRVLLSICGLKGGYRHDKVKSKVILSLLEWYLLIQEYQ